MSTAYVQAPRQSTPLSADGGPLAAMRQPMQHFMARDGGDYAAGLPERGGFGYADDSILARILGAVVPVCSGINLQYFFSYID